VFADLDAPKEIKDEVMKFVRQRMSPQPVRVRADVEATCLTYEGIDAVKAALVSGLLVVGGSVLLLQE
jgi:translation initiation factor 2 subunit 1